MATRTVNGDRASIGARTLRRDRWWLQPLVTVTVLAGFVIYGTWVAFANRDYFADPVDAVRVVLHRWEFDEVILSTLPGRRSRWLAADLPTKIRRGFKLSVTQITGATPAKR